MGCFEGADDISIGSNLRNTSIINKSAARNLFATLINKPIYSNKGYGNFNKMFNGGYQTFYGPSQGADEWINNLNENNWGWRVDNPDGTTKEFSSLAVHSDGTFTTLNFKELGKSLKMSSNSLKVFLNSFKQKEQRNNSSAPDLQVVPT